ncbi:MAG TPA: Tol-Pal system subunit TolQ [Nitrospirae bacterium]|nr:biopolymer transport protein ExbB [bacterium BMS3Abin06]HDH12977.1 Tol-Pal system subunit TolQ [Nitrospirota bacterium]HDZ02962.1 Tol-Pal system subunit TolQ [Nitrospirota bacterium]
MSGDTVLTLIFKAGPVVKFVLLILLSFSIFSWAIIFYKFRLLSKVEKESGKFHADFIKIKEWNSLYQSTKKLTLSPYANLFRAAYSMEDADRDEIRSALKRVEAMEAVRLEKYLTFLATTGSTTPFIGLFGTVWGIMNSFMGIGRVGAASLAVVAPGIAEALIATAAGLGAAIPAVVAYNYYLSRTRRIIIMMEDFSRELTDYCTRKHGETQTGSF